jgi:hypothetical protein
MLPVCDIAPQDQRSPVSCSDFMPLRPRKSRAHQLTAGYLRDLTRRAERGEFSLGPVLVALLRSQGSTKLQLA